MPIYEYKCEESGIIFEVTQSIKSDALTKCSLAGCSCGGTGKVNRVISKNVGFVFNGSGSSSTDTSSAPVAHPSACSCCSSASSCPSAS